MSLSKLRFDHDKKRIEEKIGMNALLAKILPENQKKNTQKFENPEHMELAFSGKLEKIPEKYWKDEFNDWKEKYKIFLEENKISAESAQEFFSLIWVYSRLANPINLLLEQSISEIEQTESTAVFASGMGAISATIDQFTKPLRKNTKQEKC